MIRTKLVNDIVYERIYDTVTGNQCFHIAIMKLTKPWFFIEKVKENSTYAHLIESTTCRSKVNKDSGKLTTNGNDTYSSPPTTFS